MSEAFYSLTIYPGIDFALSFLWEIDEVGVDLTDWSALFQVRKNNNPESLVVIAADTDPTAAQGTITLDADGNVSIVIPDSLTADLPQGWDYYDLVLTDLDGKKHRKLSGSCFISFSQSAEES